GVAARRPVRRLGDRAGSRPPRVLQKGILLRPLRPERPLFEIAFWLESNGLLSQRPSLPGALLVARFGAPATFWPPRSGCRESRGKRKARMRSRMQKPITMAMVMAFGLPADYTG